MLLWLVACTWGPTEVPETSATRGPLPASAAPSAPAGRPLPNDGLYSGPPRVHPTAFSKITVEGLPYATPEASIRALAGNDLQARWFEESELEVEPWVDPPKDGAPSRYGLLSWRGVTWEGYERGVFELERIDFTHPNAPRVRLGDHALSASTTPQQASTALAAAEPTLDVARRVGPAAKTIEVWNGSEGDYVWLTFADGHLVSLRYWNDNT